MLGNLTKNGRSVCIAAVFALVGLVFYLVTSMTGFLAGTAMNLLPVLCTVAAILLALIVALVGDKLPAVILDLAVAAAALLVIGGFALFALGRVSLVADVYFIPVNYPQAEAAALNLSFVGLGCYAVAVVAMVAAAFSGKLTK